MWLGPEATVSFLRLTEAHPGGRVDVLVCGRPVTWAGIDALIDSRKIAIAGPAVTNGLVRLIAGTAPCP